LPGSKTRYGEFGLYAQHEMEERAEKKVEKRKYD